MIYDAETESIVIRATTGEWPGFATDVDISLDLEQLARWLKEREVSLQWCDWTK